MIQFVEAMNEFGRWLLGYLWRLSIELTILAAVVLAVVLLLRIRSPKVRHWFGCLVLAKPVATLLIASPISLYWFLRPAPQPPPPAPAQVRAARYSPGPARPPMRLDRPRPAAAAVEAPPAPPAWKMLDRYGVAGIVWLLVAAGLGLKLVVGFAYVSFLRHSAQPQRDGPLADTLAAAAAALGMRRRAAVAVSDVAHGPLLAGIFRSMIVLPRKLPDRLSPDQMKLIFSHELAHVQRWDNLILLIQRLAEMFLFFHPVVWLCGWWMRREAEAACDDRVVGACGGPARYADSLTRVAEMRTGLTRRLLVNTFAAAESDFSRRVRRVLRGRVARMTFGVSVASVVALILVGCLGLPSAAKRKADQPAAEKDAMTKAPTGSPGMVKREGGKVWIEGVSRLAWGKSGDTTFAGALEAALAATDRPYSYNDIMGYSGLAFRVRWYRRQDEPGWCPSSPVGEFSQEIAAVARATGWQVHQESMMGKDQDHPRMERFAEDMVRSINAGRPVVGYPDNLDVAVAYGYTGDANDRTFLWEGYHWAGPHELPATKTGPWLMFLTRRAKPLSRREAIVQALTTSNWRRKSLPSWKPGGPPARYLYGEDALATWSNDIASAEQFTAKQRKSLFFVSWWCFTALADARKQAAVFCKGHADEFTGAGREALLRAAAVYDEEAEMLGKVFGKKDAFLGPWSGKNIEHWTPAVRGREQQVLARMRQLDAQAKAEMDKALAAEKVAVPEAPRPVAGGTRMTDKGEYRKVVLDDVVNTFDRLNKKLDEQYWQPRSYVSRHVVCLQAAGWKDVDYEMLMTVSGFGTSFSYHPKEKFWAGWVPPPGCDRRITQATGWDTAGTRAKDAEAAWQRIKRTMDAGQPVFAPWLEEMIFAGYQDAAKKEDRKVLALCEPFARPAKWWTWKELAEWRRSGQSGNGYLGWHTKKVRKAPARQVGIDAMKTAVQMAANDPRGTQPSLSGVKWGLAGIAAYADDVADTTKSGKKDEYFQAGWLGCHNIYPQISGRQAAAVYFKRLGEAGTFGKQASAHILAAAGRYKAARAAWGEYEKHLGNEKVVEAENGWTTKSRRQAGAAAIRKALEEEKAAIEELKLALTAAGVDVDELLAPAAEPPATSRPAGSRFPALSDAQKLRAPDGGPQRVEWAALLGDWSADSAGRITGRTDHEAYLCRVKPHADDLRLTATVRAVEGGEVTVWICGSPENAEHDGYTLAVSSGGAKLQRKGQDVARAWETTIRPGRDYVLSFERLGATLRGFLDEAGKPFVEWADSEPLRGPGHRTLGFYVWQGAVAVSKIKVEDLPPQPFTPPKPAPERPTVIGGIDYSKLSLKANGHTHDSFSLTIEAAARLLGKRPEYETIYALSTNAFAPCVNPCEPSIHWRHTDKGRGLCLDIVAGRLGLALRALPCPGESSVPPEPKDKAARDVWLREHWRKPMIQPIRAALSAGAVVITREGWNSHPPSGGLNPWCWWGLILEACDDGEILGASLNGRRDNPMWYVDGAWAVSPGTPTLTPHRADLLMLQRAVHRIRGDADPFLPTERMVFGLKAMDLWIEQMKQVPFCGDCGKGRSAACATCCAQPTYMGAETAMNYLRKRKGSFAAQARLHVEAAATHYQKILGLLRPALTGEGGEQYEQIIDNAAKQKAHAKVLQQVKAELAAAANEMEKALAAEGVDVAASTPGTAAGTATSRQVMLDDFVKVFKQMQAEVTSYNHARTDLIMRLIFMRAAGVKDADYDSLVALSGYGTSFAYHPRNYKVMYYPPDGSSATDARIAAASGFGWEWIRDCKDPDKAWGIVTESVAAGKPVEGRWYDDVVFAGYQDAPDRAGRKVYVMGGWDEPGWWTWERFEKWARQFGALGRHTKTVRKAPGRQTAVGLMKSIVKCADNDGRAEEKWMGPGKFGFDGMEAYAADVADVSKKPEYFYDGWLGCHSINRQMSARKCAAAYLREAATEFPEKVADRILAAATEYEAARAAWGEWESHLGQAGGRTKIGELKEVWSLKKNREAGAAAIRKALDRERAAVAEIEKALALTQ